MKALIIQMPTGYVFFTYRTWGSLLSSAASLLNSFGSCVLFYIITYLIMNRDSSCETGIFQFLNNNGRAMGNKKKPYLSVDNITTYCHKVTSDKQR
jgi:hypothetical protein